MNNLELIKAAEEMRSYIDKMATRQMRTHCAFDEAMRRWSDSIQSAKRKPLKLEGRFIHCGETEL